uniref:Uncharacterized protein n=1 Tax=Anguilla anguilla TaxID=7936 RepID=A0A0E9WBI4_ANGAN
MDQPVSGTEYEPGDRRCNYAFSSSFFIDSFFYYD